MDTTNEKIITAIRAMRGRAWDAHLNRNEQRDTFYNLGRADAFDAVIMLLQKEGGQ